MSQDFDTFPTNNVLVDIKTGFMAPDWKSLMENFRENLIGYLTSYGIFIPRLTTVEIKIIQQPQEGQMVYNSTTFALLIYQNGGWKTVTTT